MLFVSAGLRFRALTGNPEKLRPVKTVGSESTDEGGPRIRCPLCAWEPGRDSRWACTCLHVWNTFDTRGVCPACAFEWRDTMCLRCHEWSRHDAWYTRDDDETPSARPAEPR